MPASTEETPKNSQPGVIAAAWMDYAQVNADKQAILDWFRAATNDWELEITDDRHIWSRGSWMTQQQVDDACATIDRGI